MGMPIRFEDITAAAERIAPSVLHSPCPRSVPLSELTGCNVFCKLEYLQRTGSFKERGARNALLLLSSEQRKRGVIAASAGNHALGLAYHARLLEIPVTVVMPRVAPLTKISNCEQMGAKVILEGANIDEARQHAMKLVEKHAFTYINGYDHPDVIAGQGTLGLEIIEQVPEFDAVIVPVGGAGLIAGVAVAIKSRKPAVQIIGVEPRRAASFQPALDAVRPVHVSRQPTLADV